jgi:hypothetical protein
MTTKKRVGLGLGIGGGAALVAGAAASCPIVQAGVLGVLGTPGVAPCLGSFSIAGYVSVVACVALAIYGVARVRRSRRPEAV